MLISEPYRALQAKLHENPDYGTTGVKLAQRIRQFSDTRDILDYGCGKRTLEKALGFGIQNYDPALRLEERRPAEFVVCTDVMEHIEPECLDDVLRDMRRLTLGFCYMTIASRPAKKFLADGRNAHLIQEGPRWWLERLAAHFSIEGVVLWPNGFEVLCR